MIEFDCPECGEPLEIPDRMAGRRTRCLECDEVIDVPARGRRRQRSAYLVQDEDGLSANEWLAYSLMFAFIPAVNVIVSSVLYYAWRNSRPKASSQVNMLGFLIFAAHILLAIALGILIANSR